MRMAKSLGMVALVGICLVGVGWLIERYHDVRVSVLPSTISQIEAEKANSRWQEIGRRRLISETISVSSYQGWTVTGDEPTRDRFRLKLAGQFSASEELVFVTMDAENWARAQAGDPPLISYSTTNGRRIEIPFPPRGSFYGFFRPPAKNENNSLPRSISELIIFGIATLVASERPPARVTIELDTVGECFCTDREAEEARSSFSQETEPSPPRGTPSDAPSLSAGLPIPQARRMNDARTPAPTEEPSTTRHDLLMNQARAVSHVRTIATALQTFCSTYHQPPALKDLGSADLIGADLASGHASGYRFSLNATNCVIFSITARPVSWNVTGRMSFYLDDTDVMRFTREEREPTAQDTPLRAD